VGHIPSSRFGSFWSWVQASVHSFIRGNGLNPAVLRLGKSSGRSLRCLPFLVWFTGCGGVGVGFSRYEVSVLVLFSLTVNLVVTFGCFDSGWFGHNFVEFLSNCGWIGLDKFRFLVFRLGTPVVLNVVPSVTSCTRAWG
jgi:hypothetical protein